MKYKKIPYSDYRATYEIVISCSVAEEAMRLDNGKYNSVSDWIQGVVNRHMRKLYDDRISMICEHLNTESSHFDDQLNTIKKLRKKRNLIR